MVLGIKVGSLVGFHRLTLRYICDIYLTSSSPSPLLIDTLVGLIAQPLCTVLQ